MNPLPYSGAPLDRAARRRSDPRWVAALLERPLSRVLPSWRDRCLVTETTPISIPGPHARALLAAAEPPVLLGLDGEHGVFAADLSRLEEPQALALAGAEATLDLRRLVGALGAPEATLLAYARGILHWHRHQRFCGACGGETEVRDGGHLRTCRRAECGRLLFPRIEPAVITLVESGGSPPRALLGRHRGAAPDHFATLAGFVEVGESLEDAVRREVAEEAGVQVGLVTYRASQPWPFPAGLMIGFRARALSEEVRVDGEELEEARWFTRAELAGHRFRADSIESFLVSEWLREG